jgi:GDPmannose 4,6-dehydratase
VKTALVCGITGQDGAYLSELLLRDGYRVVGTSRDARAPDLSKLAFLGIQGEVEIRQMQPADPSSVSNVIADVRPNEIYALSAQSSVGASFVAPVQTVESIVLGTLNLLEAVRTTGIDARICHASSGDCFGDLSGAPAREDTPFRPASPYGVAKAAAHALVINYRESYGIFAANAILFNHESPLRGPQFVTRKIASSAARISAGSGERLRLGRLDVVRDWGWAPETVDAMWRIARQPSASDFVIGTGKSYSLEVFVRNAFDYFGLDWQRYVEIDPSLVRAQDPSWSGADPTMAEKVLGWRARITMPNVVERLCAYEMNCLGASPRQAWPGVSL